MNRISDADRADAAAIWDYHQMGHDLQECDAAIGLGSHDLGVAEHAAKLYQQRYAPKVVFTGATSPTTRTIFPNGEAIAYRDRAIELGVPKADVLVEPNAANTQQNIAFSRTVLNDAGIHPTTVLLVCKPYMQRRAYATCAKAWPEVTAICASEPITLADYTAGIGDEHKVIDMIVGDLQRIMIYPDRGFAIAQPLPEGARAAYDRLVAAGFTSRLISP